MDEETLTIVGKKGDRGEVGPQGIQGEVGIQGPQGLQGEIGPQGKEGRDGKDGTDGVNGKDGENGKDAEIDIEEIKKEFKKDISNVKTDLRYHGGGLNKVSTDATLTGLGTPSSPLSVTIPSVGQTPWLSDIDGGNFALSNVNNISINTNSVDNAQDYFVVNDFIYGTIFSISTSGSQNRVTLNGAVVGNGWQINEGGSVVFDNNTITSDGSGNFYAESINAGTQLSGASLQIAGGLAQIDNSGNLTIDGTSSFDGGTITTDGGGTMYFNNLNVVIGGLLGNYVGLFDNLDISPIAVLDAGNLGGIQYVYGGGQLVYDLNSTDFYFGNNTDDGSGAKVQVTGGINVSDNYYINGVPIGGGTITSSDNSLTVSGSDIIINTSNTNTWLASQIFASSVSFQGTTNFNQNMNINPSGHAVTVSDAVNLSFGTITGTKFGTSASQKIGFFNATPVVQQSATADLGFILNAYGLRPLGNYGLATSGNVSFSGNTTASIGSTTTVNFPVAVVSFGSIDAKTVANTLVFTNPSSSQKLIVTQIIVRCTAASAITVGPTIGFGSASGTSDVYASTALTTLTSTSSIYGFTITGSSVVIGTSGTLYLNLGVASTGTSQTLQIEVMGYLKP